MRPSFLILGAQRGGTTSLFAYLAQHPQVAAPQTKEIHFFDEHWARGVAWYRAHFPWLALTLSGGPLITGEATPYYLYHPAAPGRVSQVLPRVRTIALLRNPVDRAYSHWQMKRRLGQEELSFEAAVARERERLEEGVAAPSRDARRRHRRYSYIERGRYLEQLTRWWEAMPRERLLVLQSERLYDEPAPTFERVQDFLGLRHWQPPTYERYNQGDGSTVEPELRRRLAREFAECNEHLFAALGERFAWDEG